MKPNALVIGGTRGLGLALAERLTEDYEVIISGRKDPKKEQLRFKRLDLSNQNLSNRLVSFLSDIPDIELVVYAAGFYQEGRLDNLTDENIDNMATVGFLNPLKIFQGFLIKQDSIAKLIVITSSSQYTPRELEPVYSATKAALGMLANSLSLDKRVGKVLVAAPSGMRTSFWEKTDRDTSAMLDPNWVADIILSQLNLESFDFKYIKILNNPARFEIVETR